jgi:hypothetical protein
MSSKVNVWKIVFGFMIMGGSVNGVYKYMTDPLFNHNALLFAAFCLFLGSIYLLYKGFNPGNSN